MQFNEGDQIQLKVEKRKGTIRWAYTDGCTIDWDGGGEGNYSYKELEHSDDYAEYGD